MSPSLEWIPAYSRRKSGPWSASDTIRRCCVDLARIDSVRTRVVDRSGTHRHAQTVTRRGTGTVTHALVDTQTIRCSWVVEAQNMAL